LRGIAGKKSKRCGQLLVYKIGPSCMIGPMLPGKTRKIYP
jgi:hypothetical protein